jgi:dCTP deaminase
MLCSQTIRKRVNDGNLVIEPFTDHATAHGRTYGLSQCGYDIRIAQSLTLWPFWGRLASSLERIRLPADLSAEVKDKSTNARMFILVQNTIIEPGWEGYLTLELTRFLPWPIKIKKGTPIAQIVFHQLNEPTENPYDGKYQNQTQIPQKAKF